ncbi:MAG: thioredoxin domain-containing protein [Candidatus Hydrogenedentota bacterium]
MLSSFVRGRLFAALLLTVPIRAQEPAPGAPKESETLPAVTHTNRLAKETSPYLLQHAHNPVDWYPWGDEALARAKTEDKPIFLSVGYSSCHWCHVMEHESFEDEEIAAAMNEHFVCIKVDREERPDIDEIYMSAVQAMTGSGGWPMSVWLTPDLKPFYGGTYFPPDDKFGRPGFKRVLESVASAWETKRDELVQSAGRLTEHMQTVLTESIGESGALSTDLITRGVAELSKDFDAREGGFGGAPKFPSAPSIQLLLREHARTGDDHELHMATFTLDRMAYGCIYDHLGGGFARYSTDAEWLVPHFEKMLYDNAQLVQAYIEAWQATKKPLYKRIAEETFEYILRDMTGPQGGFYSAEDADSEGEEGKFYLWTYDEIVSALGEADAKLFCAYYRVRRNGNFNSQEHYHAGKNILHMLGSPEDIAADSGYEVSDFTEKLPALKANLLAIRSKRVRPGLDDKVLTSWNALMISAFAQGYQAFGEERYRDAAVKAATFITSEMMHGGELLRTHRAGESRLPAYLEDYAYLIPALLDVYEATFDPEWINRADALAKTMIAKFWDTEKNSFYFTSKDHTNLIVRTRPTYDGATPSGNSMAALGLLRLAKFLDNVDYYATAKGVLEANKAYLERAPRGYLKMLTAVDFLLYPPKEVAIAGPIDSAGVQQLLAALRMSFVPNKVVAWIDPASANAAELGARMPLLQSKALVDGKPAAYVCKDFACKRPVTTPEALLEQLELKPGDA